MNKGIEYTVEQDALDLCIRMDTCKGISDTAYVVSVKKYDENKWYVQILNKDVYVLTSAEFNSLIFFPGGYFDPNEI